MAIIKKFAPFQNLSNYQVFLPDTNPNSSYFRITEFKDTFTGGKNGFLIEGSQYLKESTEVKIEILDVEGNPIYFEPGEGVPEYYEGLSKLVSVHIYNDTPIGLGKITILGELKEYVDSNGVVRPIPDEWKGVYNVKWEKEFKINKNLSNEDIVRFYKRPIIQIEELVKPIFSKSVNTVTENVSVSGIPQIPIGGTNLSNWRAGTSYKLIRTTGSWDRDVDENPITISLDNGTTFTPTIIEVLNDKELLVDTPYTSNNLVAGFLSQSAEITYQDFQNEQISETVLTGSFAKIDMYQLKTFVGDVARVKIFRKSRNQVNDFQLVQETKLESTELLRDITTTSNTEIPYGRFDDTNFTTYWETSSVDHPVSIDSSKLSQALKIDYSGAGVQKIITKDSFNISKDVEYTLSFKTLLDGVATGDKYINAYFSGSYTSSFEGSPITSSYIQSFMYISGSDIYKTRQNVSQNIIAERDISAKLVLEVSGDDWYISNVSLRNAQETSFSPDEFTLIQDIPRKVAVETFDFRFEFYDINNNYIPVEVLATATFDGGNDFPTNAKLLTFESDRNAFRFASGSIGNPSYQQIQFKTTTSNLTGSILFTSQAFDIEGNFISSQSYYESGAAVYGTPFTGSYPGLLTSVTNAGALVSIANFSGSLDTDTTPETNRIRIGSIVYTASLENLQEFETVYRLEDGDNAPQLIVTSNANQFIYEPTTLSPKPSGQSITIRAQRKNLASLITPITVNKSDSNAPDLNLISSASGINTYTISALEFSSSFAANNFDEVTYSFTGSDVFGNQQSDEITLSKVINFDGVSIVLSNESVTFPAYSTGLVYGGFGESSGSVQMFIGGTEITHDDISGDGIRNRNTFDITSITENGVTATSTSPTNQYYSISGMSKDSGSLTLNIEYLAGDNSTSQSFQKIVSYNRSRKSAPNIEFQIEPTSQTIESNSRGSGSATPQSLTVTAREGNSSKTVSITNPPTSITNGLSGTISSNTFTFTSNATSMSADTGLVTLAVSAVNSEGVTINGSVKATVTRARKAVPNVEVAVTPSAQTIEANSLGSGSVSPQTLTVTALEGGVDASPVIDSLNVVFSGGLTGTIGTNTITFTDTASDMTSDTETITIPVNYTDSEGTPGQKTVKATITRTRKAAPVVSAFLLPQSQTIDSGSSISDITVSVIEGSDSLSPVSSITANSQYTLSVSSPYSFSTSTQKITRTGNPTVAESYDATISYRNSEGSNGSIVVPFSVGVAKQGVDGQPGPSGSNGDPGQRVATGLVYYQLSSAGAPSTPSATSYNFADNTFTGLTTNWEFGAPTFEAGNSQKYWYSRYSVTETTAGGGTGVPSFSTSTQAIGFTGLVTFTSDNQITDGEYILTNIPSGSITNHIGGPNVTTIDGGKISTGIITSTGYATTNPDDGQYMVAGTIFNLDNGSLRSKNFYIDSSGNANFRGNIAAGSFVPLSTVDGAGDLAALDDITLSLVTDAGDLAGLNSVSSTYIDNNAITEAKIAINAVTSGKISANAVVADKIAANAIVADKIAAGAIVAGKIAANAVTANTIVANAITTAKLATDAIKSGNFASGSNLPFSDAGSYLNLANGDFVTPNFAINSTGGYFSGNLSAPTGTIGGWTINPSSLTGGTAGTTIGLIPGTGIHLGNAVFASSDFRVTNAGALTATNATITGNITASTLTANTSGTIAGWTIDSNSLYTGTKDTSGFTTTGITISSTGGIHTPNFYSDATGAAFSGVLAAGTIMVDGNISGGSITGTNFIGATGEFSGNISAETGTIGGWTILDNQIFVENQLHLNANRPAIEVKDGTTTVRVDINSNNTLSTLGAGLGFTATTDDSPSSDINTISGTTTTFASPAISGSARSINPAGTFSNVPSQFSSGDVLTFSHTGQKLAAAAIAKLDMSLTHTGTAGTSYFLGGNITVTTKAELRSGVPGTLIATLTDSNTISDANLITTTSTSGTFYPTLDTTPKSTTFVYGGQTNLRVYVETTVTRTFSVYQSNGGSTYSATMTVYTPEYDCSLTKEISKTEIAAGGLQVVRDGNNYVKMDRVNVGDPMLQVGGDITATGNITANASDIRLKENIINIQNPLEKINKLNGVYFNWNSIANELAGYDTGSVNVGLIAQEVEEVLPEATTLSPLDIGDGNSYKTIWYEKLVALLVEGMKELNKKVDRLEEENKKLRNGN